MARCETVRSMVRASFASAAALLLLGACAPTARVEVVPGLPADQRCQPADKDRRWLEEALAVWRDVQRDFLKAPGQPLPQIVTYDGRCSYTLAATATQPASWAVAQHRGEIMLPNGGKIPPAPNAFNAVTDSGHNFVVMAMPSIWSAVAPKSEIPLEWFLEGVLLHELAHSYQSAVTPGISFPALLRRLPPTAQVSDDSVQEAFAKDPDYVRDYQAERDLLFRAVSAPSDAEARVLACGSLAAIRARRERHFTGEDAHWAAVDEMSLTTEGLGQWVAYTWLTRGRELAPSLVLSKLRGPYWSQEQGLATFLLVDRLVAGWQRRLFSSDPMTAERLLALACGRQAVSKPSRSPSAASGAR